MDENEKKKLSEMLEAYAIIEYGDNLYEPLASKYYTPIGIPKPELWQRLFECQKFDYIAKNIQHIPKADLDGPARGFIENYRKYRFDELEWIDTEDIEKYFTETGPKQEFWQEIFNRGNFRYFSRMNPETIKSLGLEDIETQFLVGATEWPRGMDEWNGQINDENIITALCKFIEMDAYDWENALDDELVIKEAFERSDIKDMALNYLRRIYEECINDNAEIGIRAGVQALYEYMVKHNGTGPLVQIESLLGFMGNIGPVGEEGKMLTRIIEQKMDKSHWTNQGKSNFYAVSTEMIQASPDLYLEFAELFANIPDKKDFETFATEIYPLYRAKLALLREYEDHSDGIGSGYTTISYGSVDMDKLKNQLHNALLPFNLQELSPDKRREGIGIVRSRIFGEISELFQEKFGFLPGTVPREVSKADARAIEDMTLYLSNMKYPSEARKDLIGFYLAMQFGGDELWTKMRSGEEVAPGDYLNVASAFHVEEALNKSRANNPINADNTKIESEERLQMFRKALQADVTERRLGNVQTIDLKLQNLFGNVQDLIDPDLYSEEIDKERVALLGRYPVKRIGKVAAVLHQRLSGRELAYAEGEEEIAEAIIQIMNNNGIEITADNVNAYFQKGLNGMKEPFNILANMERDKVPEKVRELQTMLMPPDNIMQIFDRLDEDFKPQSGVLALSADLDYLEGLVSKQKDSLSESELSEIEDYIEAIRIKMADLNDMYDRVIQNYRKMQKSMHSGTSAGVMEKMREIDRIVNGANNESVITSTCTVSMPVIIENMRACLSCKTKGINNDTNLTFGEGYKFYLYSSNSVSRDDSSTDEIVYFVPSGDGETKRMSFVMDRVYGMKNIDIMINHIETVLSKARNLKRQFPEVPISIIIPSSSLNSCGVRLDAAELSDRMMDNAGISMADVQNVRINIPRSGFGDHYVEFGEEDERKVGERRIDGIEVVL